MASNTNSKNKKSMKNKANIISYNKYGYKEQKGYIYLENGDKLSFKQVEKRLQDPDGYYWDFMHHLPAEKLNYLKNIRFYKKCNEEGFDKNGLDVHGFDKSGYDKDGYNKDGFNVGGYNEEGNHIDSDNSCETNDSYNSIYSDYVYDSDNSCETNDSYID